MNVENAKKLLLAAVVLLAVCGASFYAGRKTNPDKKVSTSLAQENKALHIQVDSLSKELTMLRSDKVKTTVTKFSPTTGKRTSQKTAEFTSTEALSRSTVGITGTESTRSASLLQAQTVEERSEANWNVALLGGLSPSAKWLIGAHVQYRVIGPFMVGGWAAGGPGLIVGGLSVGAKF